MQEAAKWLKDWANYQGVPIGAPENWIGKPADEATLDDVKAFTDSPEYLQIIEKKSLINKIYESEKTPSMSEASFGNAPTKANVKTLTLPAFKNSGQEASDVEYFQDRKAA